MKRLISVSLAVTMFAMGLTGCAPKPATPSTTAQTSAAQAAEQAETKTEEKAQKQEELPVLKASVMPALNSVPIKYMIDNGLDVKHGFKLETVYFANGGVMNEGLAADQWEVGIASAAAVNSLAIYGAYCVAEIGHAEGGVGTFCQKDSPIAQVKGFNPSYPDVYGDPETLKGAVIATNTGSIAHLNVNKWLEKLGLTTDDVEIVHMDYPQAYQALRTGNCDVAAVNPPTFYTADSDESIMMTSSLTNLDVPQFDAILASNKTYHNRRDILVEYVKAFYEATDALQADPDMAAQVLKDWYAENGTEFTLEECKKEVLTRPFVTSAEALDREIGECMQITGEFWISQGLLEESRYGEIAKHVDDSILKEALGKD